MTAALHETAPSARLDEAVAEDASSVMAWSRNVVGGASDPLAKPPAATAHGILAIVVRTHPDGGNSLEAAVRTAIELGWAARHHLGEFR